MKFIRISTKGPLDEDIWLTDMAQDVPLLRMIFGVDNINDAINWAKKGAIRTDITVYEAKPLETIPASKNPE